MWLLIMYFMLALLVPLLMLGGSILMSVKKMSIELFECGFDSYNVSVLPVSMRFFVFCIIFLILDLELILLSITPMVMWYNGFILNIILFLILVTVSMLFEWYNGSLSWIE